MKEGLSLNSCFHILLKPDVFHRNILEEVIETLGEFGVNIYVFDIIHPNEALLCEMYDSNFKWEYDYYIHNNRLYNLGPSLSLICDSNNNKDLKAIKGASLPINDSSSSIRKRFKTKDRCLNILHIADTLFQSTKEIKLIYNNKCTSRFSQLHNPQSSNVLLKTVSELLNPREDYCYTEIKKKLIKRIKHRIICVKYINGIFDSMSFDQNQDYYGAGIPTELNKLLNMSMSLDKIIHNEKTDKSIRFIDYFIALANRNMIYISDIEKYILYGQCYYSRVNLNE